jgi:hypothetical protein
VASRVAGDIEYLHREVQQFELVTPAHRLVIKAQPFGCRGQYAGTGGRLERLHTAHVVGMVVRD